MGNLYGSLLSNVIRIIQKSTDTTLTLCLSISMFANLFGKKMDMDNFFHVPCLGDEVLKFPWRLIFNGVLEEDYQNPKLVSAHPQISLWYRNAWQCGIALFVGEIALCYSDIQICVDDMVQNITIFHKSKSSTLTHAAALIFFITPTDLTYMWVPFKLKHFVSNH